MTTQQVVMNMAMFKDRLSNMTSSNTARKTSEVRRIYYERLRLE
jgi:hypothetical protein